MYLSKVSVIAVVLSVAAVVGRASAKPLADEIPNNGEDVALLYAAFNASEAFAAGQRYFVVNNEQSSFWGAWRRCDYMGLRLATITSQEDVDAFKLAVESAAPNANGPWWIGGTDFGQRGFYFWIVTNKPIGYGNAFLNWASGEPATTTLETCMVSTATAWRNYGCGIACPYVCESKQ